MEILKNIIIQRSKRITTFEEMVEKWLKIKKIEIKESTFSNYQYIIYKYIMPKLQKKTIVDLSKYNFNDMVSELKQSLAPKTVRDIVCVLKSILCYTEKEINYDLRINKIILPKVNIENVKVFSKREKNKLENYCLKQNNTKELGVVICLNTGLRIGEICALKWNNIDLDRKIIYVNETMERIYNKKSHKTKLITDKPKTQNSIREIPISNKLYQILKPLKKQYEETDFFLTGESTKYIEPRNYDYIYKRILKKCKIKPYKFHTIRHTFATDCIEVGMDVKALSEILGHSSVNVTLNRYVHSSYKMKKKFLEKL